MNFQSLKCAEDVPRILQRQLGKGRATEGGRCSSSISRLIVVSGTVIYCTRVDVNSAMLFAQCLWASTSAMAHSRWRPLGLGVHHFFTAAGGTMDGSLYLYVWWFEAERGSSLAVLACAQPYCRR